MDNSDYDSELLSVFFSRVYDKILIWMLISFDMDKYDYYSFFFFVRLVICKILVFL